MAIKKLCPFKLWTLQNFPFIAEDFDALTNYELMCKIVEYLNNVITVTNEQTKAINDMKEYFDNLDVQEEVNNKLDQMVTDGTLAEIINQEIFDELNNRVNALEDITLNNIKIHFPYISANNGDCYILENGEKTFVVDLGRDSDTSSIVNYLVENNLNKIDGVIITHYHGDHVGGGTTDGEIDGFKEFFNSVSLNFLECEVYLPFSDNFGIYNNFIGSTRYIPTIEQNIKDFLTLKNISFHEVTTNEIININDNTELKFLNADNSIYNNYYSVTEIKEGIEVTNYNNFSTIFELKCGDVYFLGTADIEEKAEEENSNILHAPTVVKIEHHGFNDTTNKEYLDKILNAKYGIVLNTNDYYPNLYKPTPNAFNFTNKLIWADDISESFIIEIKGNDANILTNTGISNLYESYNNHIKALNSASVFPDFATSINIPVGTDLDNLKAPSTYKSITDGVSTYLNTPMDASFRLFVTRILDDTDNSRIMQIFVANNNYAIFIRKLTSNGWTVWSPLAQYGMGQLIPNSSDLNTFVIAGKYYIGSAANSNTISNRPTGITSAPFVLEVEYMHDKRRLRQKLYNNVGEEYVRFMTGFNESTQVATFSSWYKYTLTIV